MQSTELEEPSSRVRSFINKIPLSSENNLYAQEAFKQHLQVLALLSLGGKDGSVADYFDVGPSSLRPVKPSGCSKPLVVCTSVLFFL